jgi:hypothetical protein
MALLRTRAALEAWLDEAERLLETTTPPPPPAGEDPPPQRRHDAA